MKLTIKIKLLTNDLQKQQLLKTMETFNDACNFVSKIAFKEKTFPPVKLHHLCYQDIRKQFGLSAQMAVRAIGKVVDSYRISKKTRHQFKKRSAMIYDPRILSFKSLDLLSILTLEGRIRVPFVIGKHIKLDKKGMRGQADLIYIDGVFYLCVVIDVPEKETIKTDSFLGVDLGIVNIATTSDGQQWSGKEIDKVRSKVSNHRGRLQKCGSKSAKRRLKKVSRKQRRFVKNTNHCISKKIVSTAKTLGRGIAVENLKKIKQTVRKQQRQKHGQWSFYELSTFLEYKAKLAGLPFVKVNPAFTSQTCSSCGHCVKSNRKTQSEFICINCGLSIDADFNAAINVAARATVNWPIVTTAA